MELLSNGPVIRACQRAAHSASVREQAAVPPTRRLRLHGFSSKRPGSGAGMLGGFATVKASRLPDMHTEKCVLILITGQRFKAGRFAQCARFLR